MLASTVGLLPFVAAPPWCIALAVLGCALALTLGIYCYRLKRRYDERVAGHDRMELQYRTLFEHSNDAIFVHRDGRIIDVNRRACEMLGMSRKQLLTMEIHQLHGDKAGSPDTTAESMRSVSADGSMLFEQVIRKADGSLIEVEISSRLIDDENEIIERIVRDITARKQAERELRASQTNLSMTLNSIGDAVIVTDAKGLVTLMNPVAETYTGLPFMKAKGKRFSDVADLRDRQTEEPYVNPAAGILKCGQIIRGEEKIVLLSDMGVARVVTQTAGPIRDESGRIVGIVLVYHDVTRQDELEENLRQAQKMETIGRLAGEVGHDFKNQLAVIVGYAEILTLRAKEDPTTATYVRKILASAQNATALTTRLMAVGNKGEVKHVQLDVHKTIDDAIDMLQASGKKVDVEREFAAGTATMLGDPTVLTNAFLNLGLNAKDAMEQGGALRFRTERVELDQDFCNRQTTKIEPGDYVHVAVEDTGCGMDDSTLHHLFEPFFTTKGPGKGTGLGLAAVHDTIQKHKGVIWAESEVGRGTTFHLYLPIVECTDTEIEAVAANGKPKILVIDDDPKVRIVADELLRNLGCAVEVCEDGMRAVEIFAGGEADYDLVILDMVMPRMDGKDTFLALRQIDPDLRILVATGYSQHDHVQDLLDRGAIGLLEKPYKLDVLARELEKAGFSQLQHDE